MYLKIIDRIKSLIKSYTKPEKAEQRTVSSGQNTFRTDSEQNSKDFIARKNQSLEDSQGVSDFSGSGYNGPGNVDREKRNSNMSQRNF